MGRHQGRQRGLGAALGVLLVLAAVPLSRQAAGAAPAVRTIGVVDFYAISPVSPIVGVIPERFAADDLSGMLAQAGEGRIILVARRTVQQAEHELAWHDADVLRYDRLSALAQRLHADRLVIGWIRQLAVAFDSGGDGFPPRGSGPIMATAALTVQVFDAGQGRIVAETRTDGDALGFVRPILTEIVLHRALEPAVAPTLSALTAPAL